MDAPLNEFLKYYNGYIQIKGYEPSAYDVNYWVQNFFKQNKNRVKKEDVKENNKRAKI